MKDRSETDTEITAFRLAELFLDRLLVFERVELLQGRDGRSKQQGAESYVASLFACSRLVWCIDGVGGRAGTVHRPLELPDLSFERPDDGFRIGCLGAAPDPRGKARIGGVTLDQPGLVSAAKPCTSP